MQPPGGTTVIATPLANCWLEKKLMCVQNVNCDRTQFNVKTHYKILQGIVGLKKLCWLKSFPTCEAFDSGVRQLAAISLPAMCEALAILTTREANEALSLSYQQLQKKGVPVKVFYNEQEARHWLLARC